MENSTKTWKNSKMWCWTWLWNVIFCFGTLELNNNASKQFPFEAHGTRRWYHEIDAKTQSAGIYQLPRPPSRPACGAWAGAAPNGRTSWRGRSAMPGLGSLLGSAQTPQRTARQCLALARQCFPVCGSYPPVGWHWRCKYWQKGHDGESPWERKLLFAFCCAMLTQAPCLSLVQQGHLLSNESAQRLWHRHPEVGVSGLTSVVLLWRLILRSSTKSARRRRHWYPGPRWSHHRISGPNRTKTSVDFLVSLHQHNVDC